MDDIKNMAGSVRARLYNLAKADGIAFDHILLLYLQERLLYRLSRSRYQKRFYLKGGLLILSLIDLKTRPTKDVDFLAKYIPNDLDAIRNIFAHICQIQANDGVRFDADSLTLERITEDADYQGVRLKLQGFLGKARKRLQLDLGFSDSIVPQPQTIAYPTLLDQESPELNAYSLESVVAEKFEAMLRFSVINSRMKDFYDLYILAGIKCFEGRVLQEAMATTLEKRGTPLVDKPAVFTEAFAADKERARMWQNYLKRIGKEPIVLARVMDRITTFLEPVYERILREEEFFASWSPDTRTWEGTVG